MAELLAGVDAAVVELVVAATEALAAAVALAADVGFPELLHAETARPSAVSTTPALTGLLIRDINSPMLDATHGQTASRARLPTAIES
jgi:hypothetical protein